MNLLNVYVCNRQQIDPNLKASIEWAQGHNHQLMICESAVQNPASTAANMSMDNQLL